MHFVQFVWLKAALQQWILTEWALYISNGHESQVHVNSMDSKVAYLLFYVFSLMLALMLARRQILNHIYANGVK